MYSTGQRLPMAAVQLYGSITGKVKSEEPKSLRSGPVVMRPASGRRQVETVSYVKPSSCAPLQALSSHHLLCCITELL